MNNIKKILGDNIRRFRNSRGWTQVYLADRLEITPSFLTMVESGQRGVSLDLVEKISYEFEIPIAILFVETNDIDGKNLSYFRNAELDMLQKKLILQISDFIKNSVEELKQQ